MTERYYYAEDEKVPLTPSTAYVAVQVSPEADESAFAAAVSEAEGIESMEEGEFLEPFGVALVPTTAGATGEAVAASAKALEAEPYVEGSIPVFQMPGGEPDEVMILIPQIRVQFKPDASEADIEKLNKKYGVEVVAKDDLGPNSYLLRLTSKAKQDALDLANLYHENELVEYAEPDFVYKMNKLAPPVDDPHYADQWALTKMNVSQAWGINKGRSSVKMRELRPRTLIWLARSSPLTTLWETITTRNPILGMATVPLAPASPLPSRTTLREWPVWLVNARYCRCA
jgi:thermitase